LTKKNDRFIGCVWKIIYVIITTIRIPRTAQESTIGDDVLGLDFPPFSCAVLFVFGGVVMKNGNWIPIDKRIVKYLPKDRPYTKGEALVSIQLDFHDKNLVTVTGYADLWRWSRNKVFSFFDMIGAQIVYPENTAKKQNQKGQIAIKQKKTDKGQIKDRSWTDKGQIRLCEKRYLQTEKDRRGTDKGQIRDRSWYTTSNNNNNNNNNNNTSIDTSVSIVGQEAKTLPKQPPKNQIPYSDIVDYLNGKTGKNFKAKSNETQRLIRARWNAGYRLSDFQQVIDIKCQKWLSDEKMIDFLRPQTLFGTKFESYLNETEAKEGNEEWRISNKSDEWLLKHGITP